MTLNITVSGRVQGVGFRYSTKILADQIPVFGFVKNLENGQVYIEVSGSKSQLDYFIERLRKGISPFAQVEHLEITENSSTLFEKNFYVAY
ncbi:acylphosphatase [Vagococcus sp.]|uniref:acylphosphatase n=1 Tax=Vagococcus sp. TaxID=1933889 RepID=UPI003F9B79B5